MMSGTNWDAIIIGGGAAGLFAAGTAASRGRRVLVLEKNNKAGPKILMSGGTRCNITHHCDLRAIATAFGKNGRALLSPLQRMTPQQVVELFAAEGVATKVEETGKVFPVSDRAIDVRDALVKRLERHGGLLRTGMAVEAVEPLEVSEHGKVGEEADPKSPRFRVVVAGASFLAESVLVTTGGLSYSGCGTTGDGYPWLQRMGHTITPLHPALTPLLTAESWGHALSGLTLDDVGLSAGFPGMEEGKRKGEPERTRDRGGLLWTHMGLSGPAPMNVSRAFTQPGATAPANLEIDLLPGMPADQIEAMLLQSHAQGARSVVNVFASFLPRRILEVVWEQAELPIGLRTSDVTKVQRQALVRKLKAVRVSVTGTRGYPKAEVTAGGVSLGEVNFQTMESRKHPGLYLAGEILDLDGPIGGFNFQAAWSTGHTAGLHM